MSIQKGMDQNTPERTNKIKNRRRRRRRREREREREENLVGYHFLQLESLIYVERGQLSLEKSMASWHRPGCLMVGSKGDCCHFVYINSKLKNLESYC